MALSPPPDHEPDLLREDHLRSLLPSHRTRNLPRYTVGCTVVKPIPGYPAAMPQINRVEHNRGEEQAITSKIAGGEATWSDSC